MIRILVIVKSELFIKKIEPYLNTQEIEIVGICRHTSDALASYKKLQPDIVMVDANWNSTIYPVSGVELIRSLKECSQTARIIVSTNTFQQDTLEQMKLLNVAGYFYRIMKDTIDEILVCIQEVHRGKKYYCLEK